MRSGACATNTSSPMTQAAVLGEVARDELRCARGDGGAQHERVPGGEHPEQVVQHGADVAHVDLDVRERGGAERQHDVPRARGVGHALGELQPPALVYALQQLLRAGLLEGHHALAHRAEAGGVVVDPHNPQAAVGERERERQADAAEADHRDVGGVFRHGHRRGG